MYQNNNFTSFNNQYNPQLNQQYNEYTRQMMYYTAKKRKQMESIIIDSFFIGGAIIAYLIIETIIVAVLQSTPYYTLYEKSPAFQYAFNMLAVHIISISIPFSVMALILKKRFVGPLIPVKKVKPAVFCAWVGVGMGVSIGASYLTNLIISLIKQGGYELTQPEYGSPNDPVSLFIMFVSIAVVPAIFEEYALRCCTLGALRGRGKGFAVVAVSIVFGLLHGNVIQFIFAFLVGLIAGYITVKTDNVIIAMLIHGFNNGLSAAQEIFNYLIGKKNAEYVLVGIVIAWIVIGIVSLIYLAVKHELVEPRKNKAADPGELSFGAKLACLLPGLGLPIIILIVLSTQFIKKIG